MVVRSLPRKDLICSDSCFDSRISFSTSAIKRRVSLFSSSILHRSKAESSSWCGLGMTCVLVRSIKRPRGDPRSLSCQGQQKYDLRSWSWTPQSEDTLLRKKPGVLRCYESGAFVKGGVDNVRGLNLGRSLDKSCQRLQHLRIGIGVVSFGIGFALPQTDCSHINSARTGEGYFVLKAVLFTQHRKNILLKRSRVIGKRIGFQV